MARISTFAKDLQLATAGIEPGEINKALANFARASLAEAIREGQGSPNHDRYVNGQFGADENTVQTPGPIFYVFHWWTEIVEFAVTTLINRSPVKTGRYRRSWHVLVNGNRVEDYAKIPIGADVILVNDQPYSRKIDVGFMKMSVPPAVVEDARKIVMSRFGNLITSKRTMIRIKNPYILKGVFRRGIRPNARTKLRKDTEAGAEMTYPAMILQMRE